MVEAAANLDFLLLPLLCIIWAHQHPILVGLSSLLVVFVRRKLMSSAMCHLACQVVEATIDLCNQLWKSWMPRASDNGGGHTPAINASCGLGRTRCDTMCPATSRSNDHRCAVESLCSLPLEEGLCEHCPFLLVLFTFKL